MSARFGVSDKKTCGMRGKGGWCWGSTGDVGRSEGSLQLVFCSSARDKTERTEGRDGLWGVYLFSGRYGLRLSRGCLLESGAGIQQ